MSKIKNIIMEIPKGSNIKYEINPHTGRVQVDRILYGANVYPQNYGYFENTLDWDGDALDALVIADHAFPAGVEVPVRVLGAMKMIDGGETDTKLICVIDCDPRFDHITHMDHVPAHILAEIKDFFENYKNLQKKKVDVLGFEGEAWAQAELEECAHLYKEYKDMKKDAFIKKMMKEHPEKYTFE